MGTRAAITCPHAASRPPPHAPRRRPPRDKRAVVILLLALLLSPGQLAVLGPRAAEAETSTFGDRTYTVDDVLDEVTQKVRDDVGQAVDATKKATMKFISDAREQG